MNRKSKKRARHARKSQEQHPLQKQFFFFFGIFSLALVLFAMGSNLLPITDPVESNYALTAKEMVLSGDWISPQIYGNYWYDKPIIVYWMLAASYIVLGFTDFASRLPAALCGAFSVIILIAYTRRILKDQTIAIWAGILLATSLEFWTVSHAIITDSMLMLFTIPTLFSAYIGITENNRKHMMIAYSMAGLSCLSKGPVGLILPGLLLLSWSLWTNKTYIKKLFPWQGILAFLCITIPWYAEMYFLHGNDFVSQFLGLHNFVRATASEHPENNYFYYYFLVLPVALLPWTGLFLYELKEGWKKKTSLYRFLFVWCIGTLLFYTLMATKYVTYTYIAIVPAIFMASLSVPKITRGEKIPSLCALLPFLILISLIFASTFYFKEGSWWPFYGVLLYLAWVLIARWKSNAPFRIILMSAGTASALLFLATEGLPSYMHTRSTASIAQEFHALEGNHYFFEIYPTSYVYYTGDVGIRLLEKKKESSPSETRDPRWNGKYVMPTLYDTDLPLSTIPSYIYVGKKNREQFEAWGRKDTCTLVKSFPLADIYRLEK